jgi:hypothetical protein
MMSRTATKMSWMMAMLLAGAMTLPGLALARDHDGYRRDWDRHADRDDRGHEEGHWRRHRHPHWGRWGRDREVVVVREPVYVEHRPPAPPPPWVPLAVGIAGLLHGH